MNDDSRPPWALFGSSLPPAVIVVLAGLAMVTGRGTGGAPTAVLTPAAGVATAGRSVVPAPADSAPDTRAPSPVITSAWLDDRVAGSRSARLVDDYLADMGCLEGAALLTTRGTHGGAIGLAAMPAPVACELDAIIVSIADYGESNGRWQADRTLATVQMAVGAAGFTLERFLLPGADVAGARPASGDTDPDAGQGPGVLLFRRIPGAGADLREARPTPHGETSAGAAGSRVEVLAILTVPEMPTSGIARVPLLMAAHLALTLHAAPHRAGLAHATELRVVGPFYSGSSLSLLRGVEAVALIEGVEPSRQGLQVRVISGSATSSGNCALLAGPLANDGHVTFERTVHQDETLLLALQEQMAAIRPEWKQGEGVALLTESNTGWGASLAARTQGDVATTAQADAVAECGADWTGAAFRPFPHALRLGFPLHIADRYASRQRVEAAPDYAKVLGAIATLRLDDTITPADRLPTFTPHLTDAARDLTLEGILSQLRRRRIGAVGILATDTRDRLFLAREINRVSPDVLLFGTEPDILLLHAEYQPYVRGMLMASSYPMQGHAQTLTHGTGMHERRVQFTSMAQQGLYNALLLAIGPAGDVGPLLVDYRAPDRSRPAGMPAQCNEGGGGDLERPVPWVVVVGQGEFTPYSVHPELISPQDCTVIRARLTTVDEPDDGAYLFATGQERAVWLLLPVAAIGLIGLVLLAQVATLPSGRWLSPPALLARLESVVPGVPVPMRRGERAALVAEHAILLWALVLGIALFAAWQAHMWRDVFAPGSMGRFVAGLAAGGLTVLITLGVAVLVASGTRHVVVTMRGRVARRARWRAAARRALAIGAPELVSSLVLLAGAVFAVLTLVYLRREQPGSQANLLFASARAFDLPNLLSPAPILVTFPALVVAWMVWSLRTLYYQRVSPTCALPLIHALVSRDARDRRLEQALTASLGTTMQPAGVFLMVPAVVAVVAFLLLAPRVASIEGAAFGRVVLFGTALGALAASLEFGQAAWLANRVTRLLERVRIHPLAADVEAMQGEALDWRPALRPALSPHRLLLRALAAAGESTPPDPPVVGRQDRVPVLRTQAWQRALQRSGQWLRAARATPGALTPERRRVIALVISLLLQSLVTRVVRGFGIGVLLTLLLLAAHLLTAFSGRSLALLLDIGLVVTAAGLAIRALLSLERDHVLSKLWHGTPGSLNWNSGLVWRAVVYAGIPLLTIISMRFPEVGGQLVTVVEPLKHLLPMP